MRLRGTPQFLKPKATRLKLMPRLYHSNAVYLFDQSRDCQLIIPRWEGSDAAIRSAFFGTSGLPKISESFRNPAASEEKDRPAMDIAKEEYGTLPDERNWLPAAAARGTKIRERHRT